MIKMNVRYVQEQVQEKKSAYSINTDELDTAINENHIGIYLITGLTGLVGLWGFLCLIFGLLNSGGIFKFGESWFSAVFGL